MKVKVTLFFHTYLNSFPLIDRIRYRLILSDKASDTYVVFNRNIPKYYIDLSDERYEELRVFIEKSDLDAYDVITKILKKNKLYHLSLHCGNLYIPLHEERTHETFMLDWFPMKYYHRSIR